MADAPPTESIYDFQGGSSFTIARAPQQNAVSSPSPSKPHTTTLASLPRAVIIFGFPSQMKSSVLSHFSRFGAVEDQAGSETQVENNFMKITYKESGAAQSAVAANGTFVDGQFMVGCVFAQEEPLASVDANQDDAMDIDPQTPPRPKAITQNRVDPYGTPQRAGQSSHVPASTPGGRRIEVLSSDAIYKSTSPLSERAAAWLPGWTTASETGPLSGAVGAGDGAQQQPGWPSRMIRGLVDTIFGF
ncbi:protein of unknown function [Taphrina deformans PYCC 5710]|uniref:RRM Nup35-type domain-containing protein n=1 Tax=Taphrina deformans (strain PYCC 5710 / ATCC 11124 / CBS 356.35 / IMI 108563 / JCM 9778 / NBRC 8474) TaxID=1097556 RepID=R4XEV4_TAPDE|nr:protein of unknown function [Taphrina deformans PYCC 5710]|eukprot:CCG84316.1 protein of unknown function [Taphrina deformans PYCC 5710]